MHRAKNHKYTWKELTEVEKEFVEWVIARSKGEKRDISEFPALMAIKESVPLTSLGRKIKTHFFNAKIKRYCLYPFTYLFRLIWPQNAE